MIDWLTLSISTMDMSEKDRDTLSSHCGRLIKLTPDDELEWESLSFKDLRSDSNKLFIKYGLDFLIAGSPAALSNDCNLFGSSDIEYCAYEMISQACLDYGIDLSMDLSQWKCTRIDFTYNYYLGSESNVDNFLYHIKHNDIGRLIVKPYRTGCSFGSRKSKKFLKCYNKGRHLEYLSRKGKIDIPHKTIEISKSIIRLEAQFNKKYLDEFNQRWNTLTKAQLHNAHIANFSPLIGKIEVSDMKDLKESLMNVCPTRAIARIAYQHFCTIKADGHINWRDSLTRSTYMRYKKYLYSAGLSPSDLQSSNILPFRQKMIVLPEPVESMDELFKLANHS